MRSVWNYFCKLLLETSTPLWVTLLGFVLASFGVYYLTPTINQKLETQKIKSQYVIRSLDNINSKTQEMFSEIAIINRKISAGQSNFAENVEKSVRLATELQWKALEISAVLDDRKSEAIIQHFKQKLELTRSSIVDIKSPQTAILALNNIKEFIPASLLLTNRIAALSGIKFQ